MRLARPAGMISRDAMAIGTHGAMRASTSSAMRASTSGAMRASTSSAMRASTSGATNGAQPSGALALRGPAFAAGARPSLRALAARAPRPELLALALLAAALNLWALSRNGFANEYYSAAVRSMSTSWHDFLRGPRPGAGRSLIARGGAAPSARP
jgi:hypothetical protein